MEMVGLSLPRYIERGIAMNPLRSLFVQLSRIPPAAMLVAILGLAVLVTTIVTDMLHKQEANYLAKQQDLQNRLDAKQTVVYAVKDIPEGQMIPSLSARPLWRPDT
jgi:hypothetical protein